MGRITDINGGSPEITVIKRRRFARHFPGLFAYVRAISDDYEAGVDTVVSAFQAALGEEHGDEDAFVLSLFTGARELCGISGPKRETSEREVLSLTFDAQLTREQVSALLGLPQDEVISMLLRGLRRLRALRAATEAAGDTALRGFAA